MTQATSGPSPDPQNSSNQRRIPESWKALGFVTALPDDDPYYQTKPSVTFSPALNEAIRNRRLRRGQEQAALEQETPSPEAPEAPPES